jgi:hypothetical protein
MMVTASGRSSFILNRAIVKLVTVRRRRRAARMKHVVVITFRWSRERVSDWIEIDIFSWTEVWLNSWVHWGLNVDQRLLGIPHVISSQRKVNICLCSLRHSGHDSELICRVWNFRESQKTSSWANRFQISLKSFLNSWRLSSSCCESIQLTSLLWNLTQLMIFPGKLIGNLFFDEKI